jgi:hypothetical protein
LARSRANSSLVIDPEFLQSLELLDLVGGAEADGTPKIIASPKIIARPLPCEITYALPPVPLDGGPLESKRVRSP